MDLQIVDGGFSEKTYGVFLETQKSQLVLRPLLTGMEERTRSGAKKEDGETCLNVGFRVHLQSKDRDKTPDPKVVKAFGLKDHLILRESKNYYRAECYVQACSIMATETYALKYIRKGFDTILDILKDQVELSAYKEAERGQFLAWCIDSWCMDNTLANFVQGVKDTPKFVTYLLWV